MSILITRPSPAGEALVSRLRALGQVAWSFPLIEFVAGRELPTWPTAWRRSRKTIWFLPFHSTLSPLLTPSSSGMVETGLWRALFRDWPHHGARPSYR